MIRSRVLPALDDVTTSLVPSCSKALKFNAPCLRVMMFYLQYSVQRRQVFVVVCSSTADQGVNFIYSLFREVCLFIIRRATSAFIGRV